MSESSSVSPFDQPLPPPQDDQCWHVIRTRSRQEKLLHEHLAGRGIVSFLPLSKQVRYYGRTKRYVSLPIFPGYVFVFGDRETAFEADRTRFAAQLIEVGDQPQLHRELVQIERLLALGAELQPAEPLRQGDRVEVVAGPFKGTFGTVDRATKLDRLVLTISTVGTAASLEIDRTLLQAID